MASSSEFRFNDFIGRRLLIVGEAGSGKTQLLAHLLEKAISTRTGNRISVIDMAPKRREGIGGTLADHTDAVRGVTYLRDDRISPPRVAGQSREDILFYAEQNRNFVDALLSVYEKSPTEILIINDLTIYLHAGDLGKLLHCISTASTFVGTAYKGKRLSEDKGSGIAERERTLVEQLAMSMDRVIHLPSNFKASFGLDAPATPLWANLRITT